MLPSQCRAARALIEWSRPDLAKESSVSTRSIAAFENGESEPYESTVAAIRAALEGQGVQFIEENGGGPGVRMAKGDE